MQIRPDQLANHLQKALSLIYLISGDEPLQKQEGVEAIRKTAKQQGFSTGQSITADRFFQWEIWIQGLNQTSLFHESQCIELYLPSTTLPKIASDFIQQFANSPKTGTCLVLITDKLSNARASWISAIQSQGIHINAWPIPVSQLPNWILQRLKNKNMSMTPDAIQALVDCTEGNLLATAQEIEKFHLLYGEQTINLTMVQDSISDNSRFNLYELMDTILGGDPVRGLRMLNQLRQEGTEPVLLIWKLAKELRLLASLRFLTEQGQTSQQAIQKAPIWEKRKPIVQRAMMRKSSDDWQDLLKQVQYIEKIAKGVQRGNLWMSITQLILAMSAENNAIFAD